MVYHKVVKWILCSPQRCGVVNRSTCWNIYVFTYQFRFDKRKKRLFFVSKFPVLDFRGISSSVVFITPISLLLQACAPSVLLGSSHAVRWRCLRICNFSWENNEYKNWYRVCFYFLALFTDFADCLPFSPCDVDLIFFSACLFVFATLLWKEVGVVP